MLAKAVIDNDLLLAVNPEIAGFGWGNMSLRMPTRQGEAPHRALIPFETNDRR